MSHEQSDDLVARRAQQVRGNAAIDASRHGQNDSRHAISLVQWPVFANLPRIHQRTQSLSRDRKRA